MDDLPDGLVQEIRAGMEGDIRADSVSRSLFATDASMYRVTPLGVCFPKNGEDLEYLLRVAGRNDIPVLPRGGGTSLAGQTVGKALVLDCSRYMNSVRDLDPKQEEVTVQPGVVLDTVNRHAAVHRLQMGPGVATHNRATVGGMVGNNSAGARSIQYGQTSDHLEAVTGYVPGGESLSLSSIPLAEVSREHTGTPERDYSRRIYQIMEDHKEEIDASFPDLLRNVAGYNLDSLVDGEMFYPARIMAGSEGTLAAFSELTFNLVHKPARRVLGVVQFEHLLDALAGVEDIVRTGPDTVELVDDYLLDLAREHAAYQEHTWFLEGDPEAILLVEYAGERLEPLEQKLKDLAAMARRDLNASSVNQLVDPGKQQAPWTVREGGLGIVSGVKGDAKPAAFIEDTAVPVEHLADYGRDLKEILAEFDMTSSFYGHASVGLLHLRPAINLKKGRERDRLEPITERVAELATAYGGTYAGEHGEGRARSWLQSKIFGEDVLEAFHEIKNVFDPDHLMNPGTLLDPPPMDRDLRYGEEYDSGPVHSYLDHAEQGGLKASVEFCNGNGLCRKTGEGTMCPSYMATREERDSTRGRANALREALAGELDMQEWTSRRMYRVMELCIGCKACRSECPSGVDMARLKFEFLSRYHRENGVGLRDYLFGKMGKAARLVGTSELFRRVSSVISGGFLEDLVGSILGIETSRDLPVPGSGVPAELKQKHEGTRTGTGGGTAETSEEGPAVRLFVDTFSYLFEPNRLSVARRVLERQGYSVRMDLLPCCGRPAFSKGLYDEWKRSLTRLSEALMPELEDGVPMVVLEPSCYSSLEVDAGQLLPGDQHDLLREHVYTFSAFLTDVSGVDFEGSGPSDSCLIHPHCHQEALNGTDALDRVLGSKSVWEGTILDAGCCGMAGSFGYETEHYDVSRSMAEDRLIPAIEEAGEDTRIVAPGFSCRHQIRDMTGREPLHPVDILAESGLSNPE